MEPPAFHAAGPRESGRGHIDLRRASPRLGGSRGRYIGMSDLAKVNHIQKVFDDAWKSPVHLQKYFGAGSDAS